jgi:hypothetical protein
MTLELDLELNPNPVVLAIGGSPPVSGAKRKAQKSQPRFACPFQYGEVIQPNRDVIGAYLQESGRRQLCLDLDTHMRIAQHVGSTWQGKWEPRHVYRVVSTTFGWRVEQRMGGPNDLGLNLANVPVLFATPEVAMAAAEMMIAGPPPQFWLFDWLKP